MTSTELGLIEPSLDELREEYDAYRRRQGRALVFLLPKEAVRPLLRRAQRLTSEASTETGDDPLSTLSALCVGLLPLPPFDVWCADVRRSPSAYLDVMDEPAAAPTPSSPATLEARRFAAGGRTWVARLRAFRDHDAWRGFIAFRADGDTRDHHTSVVFREVDPASVLERFRSFESHALESFLRSALP